MNTQVVERNVQDRLKSEFPELVVARVQLERGLDSTDEDAMWVWVVVEGDVEHDQLQKMREAIRTLVAEKEDPPPSWVYVRFPDDN